MQGKLTKEMVRTSKTWPTLKANAAATRHLSAYVVFLMDTFGTDADGQVRAVCRRLHRFYELLASESRFLSEAARAELPTLGSNLCIIYSAHNVEHDAQTTPVCRLVPVASARGW